MSQFFDETDINEPALEAALNRLLYGTPDTNDWLVTDRGGRRYKHLVVVDGTENAEEILGLNGIS